MEGDDITQEESSGSSGVVRQWLAGVPLRRSLASFWFPESRKPRLQQVSHLMAGVCPFYVESDSRVPVLTLAPPPPRLSVIGDYGPAPPLFLFSFAITHARRLVSPGQSATRQHPNITSAAGVSLRIFLYFRMASALCNCTRLPRKTLLVHPIPLCAFHIAVIRNHTGGHSEEYGCRGPKRAILLPLSLPTTLLTPSYLF